MLSIKFVLMLQKWLVSYRTKKGPDPLLFKESRPFQELGYKDSNLENDGVRVRCLTIWR